MYGEQHQRHAVEVHVLVVLRLIASNVLYELIHGGCALLDSNLRIVMVAMLRSRQIVKVTDDVYWIDYTWLIKRILQLGYGYANTLNYA
jgi:hypothetical protein